MRKKICLGCGLGCGTIILLLIMGFLFLILLAYMPPSVRVETKAVDYIIEHVEEFKEEINAMGYEARVAYTLGERKKQYHSAEVKLQEKIGYQKRGILILEKENEEYVFDIGFDCCNIKLDSGSEVYIDKECNVAITGERFDTVYNPSPKNRYNIDFTKPDKIGMHGAEIKYDHQIKKYISAEELREIYERCIGLQEKLVELYKAKRE